MVSISCKNVCLSFGTDTILDKVTFSVEKGDRIGVVGVNGSGKTTLMKIITGKMSKDSGEVYISGGESIGYLDQYATLDSDRSVLEEMLMNFWHLEKMKIDLNELELIMENEPDRAAEASVKFAALSEKFKEMGGHEYVSRTKSVLVKMGFGEEYFDIPVSNLSGGQKTALALVGLILQNHSILILDEPTNHLDIDSVQWLEGYLKGLKNTTVIVISHDRYFLDAVTEKTLDIENTHATLYNGSYSTFVEKKEKEREIQFRHYENQQKEIARLEAYIEQQRRWNRERNIIAAESRQKAIDRMEKIDRPENLPKSINFSFGEALRSGNDVLKVEGLSKSFDGKRLFSDLSFEVKRQDRLFILGKNGTGKSTLLKILNSKVTSDSGDFEYGTNVKVGYYDQENQNLSPKNTVLDELWNEHSEMTMTEVRSALALFRFVSDDVMKKVSVLSGGEKARLTLAKLMLSKVNLLILDEPTNHLDIASRETLENAILSFKGTVIAVSHDRYFIKKLATRILQIEERGATVFEQGYENYLEKTKNTVPLPQKLSGDASSKEEFLKRRENIAKERKKERDIAKTEKEIEETEIKIAELTDKMAGEIACDYTALMEAEKERQSLEKRLEELYEFLETLM
ncbi:MAG: ABC-F family ATP-binding cassette domain-containing protein [Ruminococcaceae bacterium]|nr:ABC-F family ATP-binding cassette domain-containing protein [Oscillospiraceae bacterium]